MWSLGNESGYGINMRKMLEKAREIDPKRLTHAEGAYLSRLGNAEDEPTSVYSRMYTDTVFCAEYAGYPYCYKIGD